MNNHVAKSLSVAFAAAVFASGCVSDYSGSTYSQSEARQQMAVYYGTLKRIEPVVIEGNEGVVGGVAGGVVGGAIGSTIGGQIGAKVGRRLSPTVLRAVIVTVGLIAIVQLLIS